MPVSNPLLNIPFHADFEIPIFFNDDFSQSYLSQLKKRFTKIEKYLNNCDEKFFRPSIKENELSRIREIQQAIIEILEQYFYGHPSNAYHLFSNMLEKFKIKDEISTLQQFKLSKNSILFRTQKDHGGNKKEIKKRRGFIYSKSPSDLFHPPFQKRRMVSTNRFSISGYPCLYLSEGLRTSYSECFPNTKDSGPFNAISLQNIRPLYFVDFSNNKLLEDPTLFDGVVRNSSKYKSITRLLSHLGVYLLIFSSHTKIDYRPSFKGEQYYFKAEYIIPQLLLQWLKQEGFAIDGVRYKSCTGARRFPGKNPHYNYVLPVQSNLEKGFCPSLSAIFQFSPVYSYLYSKKPKNIKSILNEITKRLSNANFKSLTTA